MKKKSKWTLGMVSALMALGLTACGGNAAPSSKQEADSASYPDKPITVVAPSGAGGGWDKTARSLAKVGAETKLIEQTMTVENKPGGGGAVFMAEYATQDQKNDYKLFVNSPPIIINNLKKEGNSPYGYKDTTPLAQLIKDYGAIVVRADSKYNDLKTLMKDLKATPQNITIAGGSAPGSMDHLIAVLPAFKMGVDPKSLKYVSYDGGGEAIAALIGGNADVIATDASSVGEYVKAGKVKVLAVSAPERLSGELKDIPTMKEQGADAEFIIWRGVFGPKDMSESAFNFWNEKLKALSEKEEWKQELQTNAWEGEYKNPEEFKSYLEEQEKLIKELLTALEMIK